MTGPLKFHQSIPLSLYIHLPWCVKKCPYCDFNSHENRASALPESTYIEALIRDLDFELPRIWGRTIGSVFIGGGTPSLFSVETVTELMSSLRARLNLHPDTEVTLEANPGTAEAEKFRAFRAAGINRLSIGVQSFNDDYLRQLGRIHDSNEACSAIGMAKNAGFSDFNIDIMFGLPGQTVEHALDDLQKAIEFAPSHISWYQLTIEPNTVFHARPPQLPEDENIWAMQEQGQQLLAKHGYPQYEISAYAQQDNRCLHNLNYWQFGDYLGIGAGAHSKLTDVSVGTVRRQVRHRIPARYLELADSQEAIIEDRKLYRDDLSLEFMMNALRLVDGVPSNLFQRRTGMPLNQVQSALEVAEKRKLLEWSMDRIKPTPHGLHYLNELLQLFMPEGNRQRASC